jgi:hypothetical protein
MKLKLQRIPPQWKEAAIAAPSKKPAENPKAEAAEKAEDGPLKVPEGQRNAYLASEAGRMRGQGFSVAQIRAALLPINDAVCDPPLEKSEVSEIARSIGKYSTKSRATIEPEPLRRPLKKPKEFPLGKLPSSIQRVVFRIHIGTQAPMGLCAQCVLSAINLVVQPFADVEVDGRRSPICIYLVTIGESGERKSTVEKIVNRPISKYEDELFRKYDKDLKSKKKADKKSKSKTKCKAEADEENRNDPEGEEILPSELVFPALCCEEPTYEGLVKLLGESRRSIGLFTDEGGRLIGGYAMSKEHQLKTSAGLSELWDGKRIGRIRLGSELSSITGYRFCMHIMLQPSVADILYSNPLFMDQGILSRILPTFPESTMGTRSYKPINLTCDPDVRKFHGRIDKILRIPLPYEEEGSMVLAPRVLRLSKPAKREYIRFYNYVEKHLGPGGRFEKIKGFASKACENALRLAGTITLYDKIDASQIDADAMKSGIHLMVYYLGEFLRLSRTDVVNPDMVLAEELLEWLHKKEYEQVYPKQVYQFGPNGIREKKVALKIMKVLEDHGWLSPVEGGMRIDGSHRRKVWTVVRPADAPR